MIHCGGCGANLYVDGVECVCLCWHEVAEPQRLDGHLVTVYAAVFAVQFSLIGAHSVAHRYVMDVVGVHIIAGLTAMLWNPEQTACINGMQ